MRGWGFSWGVSFSPLLFSQLLPILAAQTKYKEMSRVQEPEKLGIVECERIISILEDTTDKLTFLDR